MSLEQSLTTSLLPSPPPCPDGKTAHILLCIVGFVWRSFGDVDRRVEEEESWTPQPSVGNFLLTILIYQLGTWNSDEPIEPESGHNITTLKKDKFAFCK